MDRPDDARRRFLRVAGAGGIAGLAGCLRLTAENAADGEPTEHRTDAGATDEPTPRTTQPEGGVITCRTDSLPTEFAESVGQRFVDPQNTRFQPAASVPDARPCIGWSQSVDMQSSRIYVGPFVGRETLVMRAPSHGIQLQARARTDGSQVWVTNETLVDEYRGLTALAIQDGAILAYGENSRTWDLEFLRIDAATGRQRSVRTVVSLSDPNAARITAGKAGPNAVYLTIDDHEAGTTRLVALDSASGELLWERTLADVPFQFEDAALDDETLVLTTDEGPENRDNVWAVSAADGTKRWSDRLPIGEAVPVLDGGRLYLPVQAYHTESLENHVRAVDVRSGETVWTFEVMNPPRTGVSADGTSVYLIADNRLYALDPATGDPEWRYSPTDGGYISGDSSGLPTVCRDTLLLGGRGDAEEGVPPKVRAVDKETGAERWSFGVPHWTVQSPFVADGVLYALAERPRDGGEVRSVLYAFA